MFKRLRGLVIAILLLLSILMHFSTSLMSLVADGVLVAVVLAIAIPFVHERRKKGKHRRKKRR